MRFRYMPAIITLTAAFVASVIMIINRIDVDTFVLRLFIVVLTASVVSTFIRFIMNKLIELTKDKEPAPEEEQETSDNSEEVNT